MKIKYCCRVILFGISVPLMAADQGSVVSLDGLVIRENGRPVSNVGISALEKPPPITFGPMDDTVIGRTVTDAHGKFTIKIPRKTKISRVYLSALGPWKRIKDSRGKIVRIEGTSIPLEKVTKDGVNRIIVPNDFQPHNPKKLDRPHIKEVP